VPEEALLSSGAAESVYGVLLVVVLAFAVIRARWPRVRGGSLRAATGARSLGGLLPRPRAWQMVDSCIAVIMAATAARLVLVL